MTQDQFESVFGRRVRESHAVLVMKAAEYATEDDRLHNFNEAARLLGGTPEEACLAFMTKHFVSVADMVKGGKPIPQEYLDEKLGDLFNYCLLLESCLQKRVRNSEPGRATC